MFRTIPVIAFFIVTAAAARLLAVQPSDPMVLSAGGIRGTTALGPVAIDRKATWGIEASFEVGVGPGVELAAPLAIGIRLLDAAPNSGLQLAVGLVDICATPHGRLLVAPAAALAGQARLGPEVALLGAIDVTSAERLIAWATPPLWLRTSLAIEIDLGPWVTLAAGFAFQRDIRHANVPPETERTGWVGDSRFSLGAVRARPFSDLPTISVHLSSFADLILLIHVAIDAETKTTTSSWLVGAELHR